MFQEFNEAPRPLMVRLAFIIFAFLLLLFVLGSMAFAEMAPAVLPGATVAVPAVVIGPWNDFWLAIQPGLVALAQAVLVALGAVVTFYATKLLPAWSVQAVTKSYTMAAEAAAGWLNNHLAGTGDKAPANLTITSPAVALAVDYLKTSFPNAGAVAKNDSEIARDILAAFGKLFPQIGGLVSAGSAILGNKLT